MTAQQALTAKVPPSDAMQFGCTQTRALCCLEGISKTANAAVSFDICMTAVHMMSKAEVYL